MLNASVRTVETHVQRAGKKIGERTPLLCKFAWRDWRREDAKRIQPLTRKRSVLIVSANDPSAIGDAIVCTALGGRTELDLAWRRCA
ncbi:MAG: hypothetical protein ACRC1H_19270 [Caldilineaceae bacterium]